MENRHSVLSFLGYFLSDPFAADQSLETFQRRNQLGGGVFRGRKRRASRSTGAFSARVAVSRQPRYRHRTKPHSRAHRMWIPRIQICVSFCGNRATPTDPTPPPTPASHFNVQLVYYRSGKQQTSNEQTRSARVNQRACTGRSPQVLEGIPRGVHAHAAAFVRHADAHLFLALLTMAGRVYVNSKTPFGGE